MYWWMLIHFPDTIPFGVMLKPIPATVGQNWCILWRFLSQSQDHTLTITSSDNYESPINL